MDCHGYTQAPIMKPMGMIRVWAWLYEEWITLSSGQIPIQWIKFARCPIKIKNVPILSAAWIRIYSLDKVIHSSYNRAQIMSEDCSFK